MKSSEPEAICIVFHDYNLISIVGKIKYYIESIVYYIEIICRIKIIDNL